MKTITGPKQTIIVSCRGDARVLGSRKTYDNLITIDWHTLSSKSPPMYSICLAKDRFTTELIRNSGSFCINFVGFEMKEHAINCAKTSGKHVDKFRHFELAKRECETIDCPRLEDALSYIECELVSEHETGDHIFFNGLIRKAYQKSGGKRLINLGKTDNMSFTGL